MMPDVAIARLERRLSKRGRKLPALKRNWNVYIVDWPEGGKPQLIGSGRVARVSARRIMLFGASLWRSRDGARWGAQGAYPCIMQRHRAEFLLNVFGDGFPWRDWHEGKIPGPPLGIGGYE